MLLQERSTVSVTGVLEVESFDENSIVLHTTGGVFVMQGQALRLRSLLPEGGEVSVEGTIDAMLYEQERSGSGFFSRLFG